MPAIPATWEAGAGGSFEPRRLSLQCVVIAPLNSSLDDRVRLHLKNNDNKEIKIYLETDKNGNTIY